MGKINKGGVMKSRITVICDLCNKPVDEIMVEQNFQRDSKMFRVTCHGERDYCELSQEDMEYANTIQGARAFTTKRIT